MGSFLGCKILGVNTQTAHPVEAMELAEYLTNEQSQLRRFEARGYGPSNVNAAASEAVASDAALWPLWPRRAPTPSASTCWGRTGLLPALSARSW